MKRLLLAATALAAIALSAMAAKADLVLNPVVFRDLGATGFGDAPRLLTLQANDYEAGAVISQGGTQTFLNNVIGTQPGSICTNQNTCGALNVNQSMLVSTQSVGWLTGANVGIGLDTNQTGTDPAGLTFDTLVLTIYSSTGVTLGTFSGNGPVTITEAQLAQQQGNGNSVFDIVLNAAQQAQYDAIIAANGTNLFAGLSASFGCLPTTTNCAGGSNDGADSFLAFNQLAPVPGPVAGVGLPGLISALIGMVGLHRFRRKRRVA
jgi:hypothetical protein